MVDHLCHWTSISAKDSMIFADIDITSFWKVFKLLIVEFGCLHSFIKGKLFKQYCSSYVSYVWLLTSKRYCDICAAWRMVLMILLNVLFRTHNKILAILSNNWPLEIKNALNYPIMSSTVAHVLLVASLSLYNPWSTFNRNYKYMCQRYGCSMDESNVSFYKK